MFSRSCLLGLVRMMGWALLVAATSPGASRADVFNMPVGQTSLQFVNVGDPGNTADTVKMAAGNIVVGGTPSSPIWDTSTGYGTVSYSFAMGKYDVTVGQYVQFLNAVAKTDPYGLYNSGMFTGGGQTLGGKPVACGIKQTGTSGNFVYTVASTADGFPASAANLPVNWDSWGDAARFCNWVQNGQPTGPEGNGTTETGAYTLNGATTTAALFAITCNAGAKYWIPTENEWYKAAYYKGHGTTSGYWYYPTQGDKTHLPSSTLSTTGTNNANFNSSGLQSPNNWPLTPVGYYAGSPSAYGTFDQGGDLYDFTETPVSQPFDEMGEATQVFVMRGGSFHHNIPDELAANWRYGADPAKFGHGRTFRIATVFFPTWIGGATGADNWSALGNWDGDAPPVSGVPITFGALAPGGHAANQNDLAAGAQINGITFSSAATAYSLQGNSILLGGAVTNQSGSDQTIGLAMQLVAGGGTFDTGSRNMTLAQSISGSGIPLIKIGAGSLTLVAGSTYTGGTTVCQGTLLVSNTVGSGTGTGTVTVSAATLGGAGFIDGPVVLTGGATLASTGTLTIDNTLSVQGLANQLAGGNITTTADLTISAGAAFSINGTLSGGTVTNAGTIALLGGTFDNTAHAMSSTGVVSGYGTLRTGGLSNHGRVGVSGGDLDVFGSVVNQSDGVIDVPGGSTATFYGPVSGPGQFSGTGKVAFLGGLSTGNSPAMVAFGGDVTLGGANTLTMELAENDNTNPAMPRYDQLNVAHNVSVGGTLDLVWAPRAGDPASKFGGTYDLITYSGQLDGTFTVQCDFSAYIAGIDYAADAGAGLKAVRLTLWPLLDGDANLDGKVTSSDLTAIEADFGHAGATWQTGDFDLDGTVTWQDYLAAKANWGRTVNGGTVPEPATLSLLAAGAAALLRRRTRRAASRRSRGSTARAGGRT